MVWVSLKNIEQQLKHMAEAPDRVEAQNGELLIKLIQGLIDYIHHELHLTYIPKLTL